MNENIENSEENNKLLLRFADNIALHNGIHIHPVILGALNYDYDLAVLVSQYDYVSTSKGGQEFLYQNDNFLFALGSIDKIKKAKAKAVKLGIIKVTLKGLPARSYIKVNHDKIDELKTSYVLKTYETLTKWQQSLINTCAQQDGVNPHYWIAQSGTTNNKDINKDIIKENTKRNPASGSPSSPDVDELSENVSSIKPKKVKKLKDYEKDELFLSTWKTLPEYMRGCGPVKAYKMWVKATEKSTKNVEEIKKAITFYLKTLPEWQHPQHFSTFLNQGTWEEFCARAIEREHRQEQQPTQTENQKYWEEHENTQVIASKKIEQPKDLERRIGIARKLNLLDRFLPDEYNNEWKFMPKEIKEILVSDAVEKVINDIKSKEDSLIQQIACVTMLGREGYMIWKDEYEAETGERPTEDIEFYIPFGKKIQSDIWKWLLKYSHKFGLPSESKIDKVREWYNKKPLGPVWLLFS